MIRFRLGPTLLLIGFASAASGCIGFSGTNGVKRYLIIGVGLVTVNEVFSQAVVATNTHALGISISDQPGLKFAAGYSSNTVVSIGTAADDIRVEVSQFPGGPLIVDAPSAKRKEITIEGE